jgi:hypothetical protein
MIAKKAKAFGWTRDLAANFKAKAEEKVNRAAVNSLVNAGKLVTENQVGEANAEVQFRIRMEHRQDIGRTRALFRSRLEEMKVAGSLKGRHLSYELIEVAHPEQDGVGDSSRACGRQRLFDRITARPERINGAKKLTEMLAKLVRLDREAHGPAGEDKVCAKVDALLMRLGRAAS